ncbi:MAG: biotin carboxyl carrier protein [Pseudohongiellaceae bacterium]|jgi:biotin carboxyl carrier protein
MGHAYTPGLKVSAAADFLRSRLLPIRGEVLVRQGDVVDPDTVVARALLPGNVSTLNLARQLGMAAADLFDVLLVKEGDAVEKGQPLARSKGIFGMMKKTVESPTTGVLESVSKVSGQALFRESPIPVDVKAYVGGTISEIEEGYGVHVDSRGTMVQGIFGIGPETNGKLAMVGSGIDKPLQPSDFRAEHQGAVCVGGSLAPMDALKAAIKVGVAAIVTGGIDANDLKELLGFDLGVAITGNEDVGLTLMVTEGFGALAMSKKTHELLAAREGLLASVSGATQIRAGVLRPEVLVPHEVSGVEKTEVDEGFMHAGSVVRIIRDPHFGALGKVIELPPEPAVLDTEAMVRILTVTLKGGERVTLPRANVELVDEQF